MTPLGLEATEPVGEDVRRDARQQAAGELVPEPARTGEERLHDEEAPSVSDPLQRGSQGGRGVAAMRGGSYPIVSQRACVSRPVA